MTTSYRVTARRAGDWWALEVPDLPGVFSQTKRLDQAGEHAQEAIAVMLDVEPKTVKVEVEPILPPEVIRAMEMVERARKDAEKASEAERAAMRDAARVLTKNLSQRDAGRLMGLSFQRVSQLIREASTGGRGRRAHASRSSGRERAAS